MRQTASPAQRGPGIVPGSVRETLRSPGQPVDTATRTFMESRFGHDFSRVRVHTDARAAESAHALDARAYTVGQDIVFGRGQYAPHSTRGKQLLAHELTHTLQQRSATAVQQSSLSVSQPGDAAEREADRAAESLGLGARISPTRVQVARQLTNPAEESCGAPCGSFPWTEITPKRLMSLCSERVQLGTPKVPPISGCTPGRPGKVLFLSGGWDVKNECAYCKPGESREAQSRPDPTIQVGFIQTVERALQGGVYYKQVAGRWEPTDRIWFQETNKRDCLGPWVKAPWYGPDKEGNYGPQPFGGPCPIFFDQPYVVLPTHHGDGILRRVRIDSLFRLWLVARLPSKKTVFIRNWTIDALAVAELPDHADPCNFSQWEVLLGGKNTTVTAGTPGQGPGTPVLTGGCANATKGGKESKE